MLRHVVMWTLRNPADAPRFKLLLDSCKGLVPGMLQFEVGVRTTEREGNVDVILVSAFADVDALHAYHHHPHHKAVSSQLGPLRQARSVLDYDTPDQGPQ
jgi:quinol monooxygenase YgiN